MILSDYIAQFLVDKDIKDVFFVDGSAAARMLVSIAQNRKLRYWCPLHEQAGAFMMDGYYKASHKMSAMFATSGPGGQNLLNGIAASYYDSIPAIYFTGQVNSRFIKPNESVRQWGFQEHDIVSTVKPCVKYTTTIMDAKAIRYELEKAYHIATSGRPGPVLLDMPMDIQRAKVREFKLKGYAIPEIEPYSTSRFPTILAWLRVAKRPAILLGGGVWLANAVGDARALARKLVRVPFFVTWNMLDYYDPDHYGGKIGTFGGDGRNFAIQNCDFLLAIGSRISGRITGGLVESFARGAKKVIVDIDRHELRHQQVKGNININCDAKIFINELISLIEQCEQDLGIHFNMALQVDPYWFTRVCEWRKRYPVVKKEYYRQACSVNPYVFVKVLSELMQEGDILCVEASGNCVVASQAFEPKANQRFFTNNGNSSLGYALPASIGASIATGKKINCICGDGGLNFNIQELQTLAHHRFPVKVFIFDNRAFGITKLYRDTHFRSEYAGVDAAHGMSFPDFGKVARAYGLKYVRINNHKDLRRKIRSVLEADWPVICDVNMVGFYDYKPRLDWGAPVEMQYPMLSHNEFKENMIIEPVENWKEITYPGVIK
jgi:acetolactate synthase-1/2/3 large subunit